MRVAGLAMITLGLVGLGMSLVDWQSINWSVVDREAEQAVAEIEPGPEDQEPTSEPSIIDTAESAPAIVIDEDPPTEIALQSEPSTPPDASSVSPSSPASVKVFQQDVRGEQSAPELWADIAAGSEVVSEDSGHANFLVTLSEPADRSVVIIFSTVDLSATDKEDYQSQRGTVTFEPGVVSAEIRTPLVDDDIKEDDEQFAIVLNGAPGIVSFKSRRVTATIRDND